jgi:hypothetical protein
MPIPLRVLIAAIGLLIAAPVGLSASSRSLVTGPQPIYSAFSLLKTGKLTTRRCGAFSVAHGTYTGRSASPDPRLAGVVTYVGRIALTRASTSGIAWGTMTLRDSRRRVRMRATVSGVVTQSSVVNGLVTGTLMAPAALLLANVTMVFDDELGFAAVRLGLDSGLNSAVAYPAVPKC